MTDEERRIITSYVERVSGATNAAPARPTSPWGAMGGAQAQPPLPPLDRDADALISDLFNRHPEARYRITQTAFVQEHAVVEMQNRIQQLEWEVENAQRQGQAQQSKVGLFGGMFGGGAQRPAMMPPRPQPQYPPGYNPAALQQGQGRGFLGTAMMTAVGVAGGLMLGSALMSAFGGGGAQAATPEAVPTGAEGGDAAVNEPQDYGNDAAAFDEGGYDEEV